MSPTLINASRRYTSDTRSSARRISGRSIGGEAQSSSDSRCGAAGIVGLDYGVRANHTKKGGTMRMCKGWRARSAAWLMTAAITGCAAQVPHASPAAQRLADREAIESVLGRANLGFELSDPDMFANAFAEDAEYVLDEKGPVFGYDKMIYRGRADIRSIITARIQKARARDPKT